MGGGEINDQDNSNYFSNNFRFDFSNSNNIRVLVRNERKYSIDRPFGTMTVTDFDMTSRGDGILTFTYNNPSQAPSIGTNTSLGIISVFIGDGKILVSAGIRHNFDFGLSNEGLIFGGSSKTNGVVFGTHYSWTPSQLWLNFAPAPSPSSKFIFKPGL